MTSTSGLGDDSLEVLNLGLGTTEGTELAEVLVSYGDFQGKINIPSSLRAYGHACPCCYGGVR